MATKYVAAAAIVLVAASQVEAIYNPNYKCPGSICITSFDEEEQKVNWKKFGKGLKKGLDLASKARQVGLLEEEQAHHAIRPTTRPIPHEPFYKINVLNHSLSQDKEAQITLKKIAKTIGNAFTFSKNKARKAAKSVGVLEEEEEEEEEEELDQEQKFKLGKAFKKLAKVAVTAHKLGLLEDDEIQSLTNMGSFSRYITTLDEDEQQKFDIQPIRKLVVVGAAAGLLEQDEIKLFGPRGCWNLHLQQPTPFQPILLDEEQGGSFGGGVDFGPGGPSVHIEWSHTYEDEEEEQKIKWNKIGNALGKGLDLYGKAKGVGLFDVDEEQGGSFGGGVDFGPGGPSVHVEWKHTWEDEEEEEEEQKIKWNKIGNSISKGLDLYGKAKGVGLFEDEEQMRNFFIRQEQHQLPPQKKKTLHKLHHLRSKAALLEEEEEEEEQQQQQKVYDPVYGGLPPGWRDRPHHYEEEEQKVFQPKSGGLPPWWKDGKFF